MKVLWTGRVAQTAARYGEHAPAATACCNACRSCVQANVAGLALAVLVATGTAVAAAARRVTGRTA